mmetsp:Transcript_28477/g.62681  ORF Transcript_28477/g.62681 Transcript_28477/m.62681 type:complete len:203 (-) Transcript_28477:671-1279(-)
MHARSLGLSSSRPMSWPPAARPPGAWLGMKLGRSTRISRGLHSTRPAAGLLAGWLGLDLGRALRIWSKGWSMCMLGEARSRLRSTRIMARLGVGRPGRSGGLGSGRDDTSAASCWDTGPTEYASILAPSCTATPPSACARRDRPPAAPSPSSSVLPGSAVDRPAAQPPDLAMVAAALATGSTNEAWSRAHMCMGKFRTMMLS